MKPAKKTLSNRRRYFIRIFCIFLFQKFNQTESDLAISDLKSLLCEKLNNEPKACK